MTSEFRWPVPSGGFRWSEGENPRLLAQEPDTEDAPEFYLYNPMRFTALFKTFADLHLLSDSERVDGILAFANKRGSLWSLDDMHVTHGLREWVQEIANIHKTISMWDQNATDVAPRYRSDIGWSLHDGEVFWMGADRSTTRINRGQKSAVDRVNTALGMHNVYPRLRWSSDGKRLFPRLVITPGDMISALWVQLSRYIEGDRQYRKCDECSEWFEIEGERRADARFCGNACRFRAYRKRQKRASELAGQGTKLEAIANELGSNVETVSGWIEQRRKAGNR
jgi:hypothetical protein